MFQPLNRIIIVDDDYISLFLTTKFLAGNKIADTTLPFTNGIDALRYLEKNAQIPSVLPELILLDIMMPDINGWQFLAELNNIEFIAGYEPVVCIVSAQTITNFEILKSYPYIKGYLLKPIELNKFIAMLESIATKMQFNKAVDYATASIS